jgi:HAD superfamily hydrolase (TIGR01509 family)
MLKAILFDVDGTLAETEEFHRNSFNAAFARNSIPDRWSMPLYRDLLKVTGGKERIRAYFRDRGAPIPDPQVRAIHDAKNALYAQSLTTSKVRLRPGVRRLIHEAREAGLQVGIATTTTEINVDALLRAGLGSGWPKLFACVVAGDQVERKKPAPDVYIACLARLGIEAHEAVAIEDSPAGVIAARSAGIRVVATPSLYTEGDDFSLADHVLPDLGDPESPWSRPQAWCRSTWLRVEDLQRALGNKERADAH